MDRKISCVEPKAENVWAANDRKNIPETMLLVIWVSSGWFPCWITVVNAMHIMKHIHEGNRTLLLIYLKNPKPSCSTLSVFLFISFLSVHASMQIIRNVRDRKIGGIVFVYRECVTPRIPNSMESIATDAMRDGMNLFLYRKRALLRNECLMVLLQC